MFRCNLPEFRVCLYAFVYDALSLISLQKRDKNNNECNKHQIGFQAIHIKKIKGKLPNLSSFWDAMTEEKKEFKVTKNNDSYLRLESLAGTTSQREAYEKDAVITLNGLFPSSKKI